MIQNITQFFSYMNDIDFPYVVLRNFEGLPDSIVIGSHGDLDLLVYDFDHWKELFPEAQSEYPYPRVRFSMPVGDTNIYVDVRHIGDDYYPEDFEKAMIESREWNSKGFWTPNPVHFRLGIAYHAVHHKNENIYEKYIGEVNISTLLESLKKSNIGWVEPKDKSVGRFNAYWKGATSVVERSGDVIKKRQISYGKYNLTQNEYRILSQVSSKYFPRVLSLEGSDIIMEDCGIPLTVDCLPKDWKEQLVQILLDLRLNGIQHRDIKPDNLMLKDGTVKLIDFGWARLLVDAEDNPPSCLGYPYKPSDGYNDNYSMRMVIKQLEYQIEEKILVLA